MGFKLVLRFCREFQKVQKGVHDEAQVLHR